MTSCGFQTASGKSISFKEESLQAAERIFHDDGENARNQMAEEMIRNNAFYSWNVVQRVSKKSNYK
jgi:hypothetical protein